MNAGKSSISQATSYEEMGAFWDTHDTADYWDQMETVEFDIDIQTDGVYFAPKLPRTQQAPKGLTKFIEYPIR